MKIVTCITAMIVHGMLGQPSFTHHQISTNEQNCMYKYYWLMRKVLLIKLRVKYNTEMFRKAQVYKPWKKLQPFYFRKMNPDKSTM